MIIKIKDPENIGLYSLNGKDYFHNESIDYYDLDIIDLFLYRETMINLTEFIIVEIVLLLIKVSYR